MSGEYGREVLRRVLERERGTWRERLRAKYELWFRDLEWGFQCHDGWRHLIEELTEEIAKIVGGPAGAPEMKIVQIKEKFGGLRYYVRHVPERHSDAVYAAVNRAGQRSFEVCEVCGWPGRLVKSIGYWHTACPEHEDPSTFRWRK